MKIPLAVLTVLLLPVFVQAQAERIIEGGGAGTHKAVAATDLSFPECTVFRPADMEKAVRKTTLPLVLFEGDEPMAFYERYLNEIASFGYVVIAAENEAAARLPETAGVMRRLAGTPGNPYSGKVDTTHVALLTCRGTESLLKIPELTTAVCLNARCPFSSVPVLFVAGGLDEDIYPGLLEDYGRIGSVFAATATYPAGREGTFSEAFGGSYASVTLQWLEWWLKDKPWSRTVFTGEDCFCRYEGWGIAFKNEKTVM